MKKTIKWVSIILGSLVAGVILALLIIPFFINVQKYRPQIEKMASASIGRPVAIGGDIRLSLFPWAGLSFSDLRIGNPPGFQQKDFVVVKSFEARVKLLPLISKEVQIKRFVVQDPRIVLERRKDGLGNWQGIGGAGSEKVKKEESAGKTETPTGLPIKSLTVGEFAITGGRILWIDDASAERREVSDLNLRLEEVSLDRPIHLTLSARLNQQPVSVTGEVGPIGKDPGKGSLPLNLLIKAFNQLNMGLKGSIRDYGSAPQFDLSLQLAPFSPRKLFSALEQKFPIETADKSALNSVALKAKLQGDHKKIRISDGVLDLDQSKMAFSMQAKDFDKPDVAFNIDLDRIDLDRYLSPPPEKAGGAEKKAESPQAERKKTDYTPLRKVVLDGILKIGTLKAKGLTVQDVNLKVTGKNGLFDLDPFDLKLYQGTASIKAALDVRANVPKSRVRLDASGIQAGPLIKDYMKKDFLEGILQARADIGMKGDDAEGIKRSLNGNGDLLFKDGAIVGIDLVGMVRNAAAAFGLAEAGQPQPKTDFAELHVPFAITNGVVKTSNTTLLSPFLRVAARGDADLAREDLDFRIEPKFVDTLKGQGDTMQRSGITVPVLVTGTFSAPKFRPDLEALVKQGVKKGIEKELPKLLKGKGAKEINPEDLQKAAEGILKAFPLGK